MASQLKKQYATIIMSDTALLGLVAQAAGRSVDTIQRWVNTNNEKLTMFSVLEAIRKHLALNKSVVLTEEVEVAEDVKK